MNMNVEDLFKKKIIRLTVHGKCVSDEALHTQHNTIDIDETATRNDGF